MILGSEKIIGSRLLQALGSLCVIGEMFPGVGSQKLHVPSETSLCPGLRKRYLFSGKGVKHL